MDFTSRMSFLGGFASLVFLLLPSIPHGNSSSTRSLSKSNWGIEKVKLAFYYETLCPYCSNFIVNDLIQVLEDDSLVSLIDLKLIPYGNARIGPNDTISCQHGPYECLLNTVEACAIDVWPQLSEHFPFIYCIESLVYEHKYPEWESCFETLGLDPKPVSDCYSSGDGKKLELQYAAETDALVPPHEYVPWVVVDGQPLYEDYENFVSYICKAYNGTATPKACSELSHSIQRSKERPNTSVCFKEMIIPTLVEQKSSAI